MSQSDSSAPTLRLPSFSVSTITKPKWITFTSRTTKKPPKDLPSIRGSVIDNNDVFQPPEKVEHPANGGDDSLQEIDDTVC